MPKILISLAVCTLSLLTVASVRADDSEVFVALKTSIGAVSLDQMSHHGTIGTGLPFGAEIDGRLDDTSIDDYTAGLGVSFGKRWNYWTVEGEILWRYRTDWDLSAPTHSIGTVTNVFSDVGTTSFIINVLRRGPISQHWSWELGAGVGMVRNKIEAEYIERATPTVPEFVAKDDSSESDFSYNAFAGVIRSIGGSWSMNIRYRFIELGELEAGPFRNRAVRLSADHSSHEMQLSFERKF
ncbi:MAG: outer membrane beta-barrel protein [Pseudomonadales bacterium]|nr:outer membrane beta-barrel protein [Pseudomonadales bacterium]